MDREKIFMVVTGLIIGILAAVLVVSGNPGNMGFCIACFLRMPPEHWPAGRVGAVPETGKFLGLVIGAFIAAFTAGEFRSGVARQPCAVFPGNVYDDWCPGIFGLSSAGYPENWWEETSCGGRSGRFYRWGSPGCLLPQKRL